MTTNSAKLKRQRLKPEVRKSQILDVAAAMIREHGVSALSMSKLGEAAGISKPLIYVYFDSRLELFKALLVREVEESQTRNQKIAEAATGLEDLVRSTSRSMLEHVLEHGNIVQQLMHEPEIADVLGKLASQSHQRYIQYLAQQLESSLGLSPELSEMVVEIGLGLSSAAGAHLDRTKTNIDAVEEVLVTMILGSLSAISDKREHLETKPKQRTKSKVPG